MKWNQINLTDSYVIELDLNRHTIGLFVNYFVFKKIVFQRRVQVSCSKEKHTKQSRKERLMLILRETTSVIAIFFCFHITQREKILFYKISMKHLSSQVFFCFFLNLVISLNYVIVEYYCFFRDIFKIFYSANCTYLYK